MDFHLDFGTPLRVSVGAAAFYVTTFLVKTFAFEISQ